MGSATSATIKQQAKALQGRRYMRGMRPEKYFEVVVKKEHGELLDILGLSDEEAFEILIQFISIDDDNSGEVSLDEFHRNLNSQATKFSERVFAILDKDMNGFLDLREFIVGVWNYCTYDTKLIAKLLFDIFDVDRRGIITMAELDAMLRMLYASREADPDILQLLAINGSGDEDALTFDEFLKVVKENYQVVQPAFDLQRAIRRKVLGVKYWENMTCQRAEVFASYDKGDMTSVQAIEAIVLENQKERADEKERNTKTIREVTIKHDEDLKRATEENRAIHEDQKVWKMRKLDELRESRPADEVEEEEAWKALRQAQAVVSTGDFTEDNVHDLRIAREILWDCYERAVAASKTSAKLRANRAHELALGDDANSKADAWITTKQGKVKYEFLCRQAYGNLLHKDYDKRGLPMKAFAALHAPDDAPVSLATNIAYGNPRPAILAEAKASARQNVVDRFAKQEASEAATRAMREAARQEVDFLALHQQVEEPIERHTGKIYVWGAIITANLVDEAGARGTSWDFLRDPKTDDMYYLHLKDNGSAIRHPKDTAVCDKCDAVIDPEDRACSRCDAARSKKNYKLYKGLKT